MTKKMFALINLKKNLQKQVSFTDQIPPDIWSAGFGYVVGSFTWGHIVSSLVKSIQWWKINTPPPISAY